jgi:hypothetical protein
MPSKRNEWVRHHRPPVRGGMFIEADVIGRLHSARGAMLIVPEQIGIPHPARGAMFIEPEVIGILHPARGAMCDFQIGLIRPASKASLRVLNIAPLTGCSLSLPDESG